MIILAIETSCDDTCAAILKIKNKKSKIKNFEILSNIVSSQVKIHKKYGGVYPFLAKREHQKNLPLVLEKVLKKAKNPKIDLIVITVGPGLEPCLWVGVNFAKELAKKWNLPVVPVNHIEAHILANAINNQQLTINNFPAVCLVVSGGHTQLILMEGFGKYKILGETRDDAAGECFDKTARILGLGYPGGPAIAANATKLKIQTSRFTPCNSSGIKKNLKLKIKLPRPMINQKNYDFSFSGLKTAVLYNYKSQSPKTRKSKIYIKEMCGEVQQAIIDVLIKKTIKAAKNYRAKTIILGGGVSANNELRKQFKLKIQTSRFAPCNSSGIKKNLKLKINFLVPPKNFCTDNAVMTAIAGYFGKPKDWRKIKADANLKIC